MVRSVLFPAAILCLALPTPAAAQIPPEFERALQCAAAANVSQLILQNDAVPANPELRALNDRVLSATTEQLHRDAATLGADPQRVEEEVSRRATIMREELNSLPDSQYLYALRKHLSFGPGGGMASCALPEGEQPPSG